MTKQRHGCPGFPLEGAGDGLSDDVGAEDAARLLCRLEAEVGIVASVGLTRSMSRRHSRVNVGLAARWLGLLIAPLPCLFPWLGAPGSARPSLAQSPPPQPPLPRPPSTTFRRYSASRIACEGCGGPTVISYPRRFSNVFRCKKKHTSGVRPIGGQCHAFPHPVGGGGDLHTGEGGISTMSPMIFTQPRLSPKKY